MGTYHLGTQASRESLGGSSVVRFADFLDARRRGIDVLLVVAQACVVADITAEEVRWVRDAGVGTGYKESTPLCETLRLLRRERS